MVLTKSKGLQQALDSDKDKPPVLSNKLPDLLAVHVRSDNVSGQSEKQQINDQLDSNNLPCNRLLSMKTLLTGLISVVIITLGVLFFCEYIPQARQIKQNHPTLVIVLGITLLVVGWHALHTILLATSSLIAPLPIVLIHAAFRSIANLLTPAQVNENLLATPLGQVMQMIGVEPKMSVSE